MARRRSSSSAFSAGGRPSKTKIGLMPWSAMSRVVRKNRPERCEVMWPWASFSGVPSRSRINARNWYRSPCASTASIFPRRSPSAIGRGWTIGVSTTPMERCYMRFAEVVDASTAVAALSARLQKIARLADLFRALAPDEIEPVVALLAGAPRQGRIGLGYATLSAVSHVASAAAPQLSVAEVDTALGALADTTGAGSARERVEKLSALFARATREEQDFLRRILYG